MSGYDENFLDGITLPLPTFSGELEGNILRKSELRNGICADYINYSVIMNGFYRTPALVALNINQNLFKSATRRDNWRIDTRIGYDYQLDNAYYRDNPWDRGHMARRTTAAWGPSRRQAQRASDETFYFSNSCLQHANLNQDEWLGLEDWVKDLELDADGLITSFSGPVMGDTNRSITPSGRPTAVIPSGFFKVVCFKSKKNGELDVRAFIMYQDEEALRDKSGRNRYNNQTYQVTITEIEEKTGLQFADEIYEKNPLYYDPDNADPRLNVSSNGPERIEVSSATEVVGPDVKRDTILDDDVDVYIAAAMVNPDGDERAGEWVSIINFGNTDIDLAGWKLGDTKRQDLSIDTVLKSDELVMRPGESRVIGPVAPLMLANKGGVITLKNSNGERIDRVNYLKHMVKDNEPVLFLTPRDTLN